MSEFFDDEVIAAAIKQSKEKAYQGQTQEHFLAEFLDEVVRLSIEHGSASRTAMFNHKTGVLLKSSGECSCEDCQAVAAYLPKRPRLK
jgi:hypothetical protein